MEIITSKDNNQIRQIRKLKDKKGRDEANEYFIEGIKLIREAIAENAEIKTVVVCNDCLESGDIDKKDLYEIAKYNCIYANESVFKSIVDVQTHQGILAVVAKKPTIEMKDLDYNQDLILVLDNLQDPGNMGTILRTLDSTDLNQIVISKGSSDIYSPKVVRSTMGAIFRLNILESENLKDTIKEIKKHKFEIIVTALEEAESVYNIEYKKTAIIIGNEANGVSKEIIELADKKAKIPMLRKNRKFKCFCCNRDNFI